MQVKKASHRAARAVVAKQTQKAAADLRIHTQEPDNSTKIISKVQVANQTQNATLAVKQVSPHVQQILSSINSLMQVSAKQPEPTMNSAELDKIFKKISDY